MLTNLTSIKIRASYSPQDIAFLDDVQLDTVSESRYGEPAGWVEQCNCPQGYIGQFCESCLTGYRHDPPLGGPFMSCVPCNCNNHSDYCHSESGKCKCQDNTDGDNCEYCKNGYYGNALEGTPNDCKPCNCPGGGACVPIDEDQTICTECPKGRSGYQCEVCSEGWFGDPSGQIGPKTECRECDCNNNVDENAIGNCNTTSGECLKCIYNTGGPRCDQCLEGFWGNALAIPRGLCEPCQCYPIGTELASSTLRPICNQVTGACHCKIHVVGKNCDQCEDEYFNLMRGEGCQSCDCNPTGSSNQTCDILTGQCYCRPGVTGLRCDHCEPRKYNFTKDGCKDCACDPIGSRELQCDSYTGQCPCLDNVEGRQCDRCKENKYDRQRGCVDCPDCYNLVQNAARSHNEKLQKLNDDLDEIERRPTVIKDDEFQEQLKTLQKDIGEFHEKVVAATGENSIVQQVQDIKNREKDISRTLSEIDENVDTATDKSNVAERTLTEVENDLQRFTNKLDLIANDFDINGKAALNKARDKAKAVGQQSEKMTIIAQQARELADSFDLQADELNSTAHDAKNKSSEAYKLAEGAISLQVNVLTRQERELRNELINIENALNRTKQLSENVNKKAKEVKKDALTLFNQVENLLVPQLDVNEQKEKALELTKEAERIEDEARDLLDENEKLLMNLKEQLVAGNDLIIRADDQQFDLGQLINDIELYGTQINKTIDKGNKLLNSTRDTYKILSDFDQQAQQKKQAAKNALATIPEINSMIEHAFNSYAEAHKVLEESKNYAKQALNKALEADGLAKNASQDAEAIKKEAEELERSTNDLQSEAEDMHGRVSNTNGEFKKLYEQNKRNDTLMGIARDKVAIAFKETTDASGKVSQLLESVQEIINELENLPNIDEEALEQLEEKYRRAEENVKQANLDEKLNDLKNQRKEQNALIAEYEKEIARLQKDVENIEQISRALPQECFNKLVLEPDLI